MPPATLDFLTQPVPVVRRSGPGLATPLTITADYDDDPVLAVRFGHPLADIGFHFLLRDVLQAALAPRNNADWVRRLATPPTPAELETALAPYRDAFIIDHPVHPALQVRPSAERLAEAAAGKPAKGKKKAKDAAPKPKRVSLPKGMTVADLDLDKALKLLALPRTIGNHPETGQEISAGIGRFGPYIKHGPVYKSLPPDDDVLEIGINRAVSLLGEAAKKAAATPGRTLGDHPKTGKPVTVGAGRFGPYVKHGSTYASIPKAMDAETVTLEQGLELLEAKAAKDAAKKGAKAATAEGESAEEAPKKTTRKPAAKKTAAPVDGEAAEPAPKKAAPKKKAAAAETDGEPKPAKTTTRKRA